MLAHLETDVLVYGGVPYYLEVKTNSDMIPYYHVLYLMPHEISHLLTSKIHTDNTVRNGKINKVSGRRGNHIRIEGLVSNTVDTLKFSTLGNSFVASF